MTIIEIIVTILLGTAAGFINTFAGGGSMLVVPFLIFIGLPANVANATNRIAILLQNVVSVSGFKQKKILDFKTDSKLLLPVALGSADKAKMKSPWLRNIIFFFLGIYGGFIQIGIGFFLLAGLVLGCGYDLLKANAIKLFIVLFYTIIALAIFIWNDLVDFKVGLILACGNMLGAWLGVRFSIKWGAKYIRYFLLVVLVIVAVRLFFS